MKAGIRYQKAGILLLDLVPADQAQGGLFQPVDERTGRLTAVMDRINHAQGSGAVRLAACGGPEPAWRGRSDFRSPRYTTRWEDIPEVR
jgi:DNA polymerase V